MFTASYNGYAIVIVQTTNERGFAVMVIMPSGNKIHDHAYTQKGAFTCAHQHIDRLRKYSS